MQLFRRILLSFFPKQDPQFSHPASMFVPFITSRDYFLFVCRKSGENPKLNFFDSNLDTTQQKIGFGHARKPNEKQLDLYFGYHTSAQLNGLRNYAPSVLATHATLLTLSRTHSDFDDIDPSYFRHFTKAIYITLLTFASRIKTFPETSSSTQKTQEKFNHFFATLGSIFQKIFELNDEKFDPKILNSLSKSLTRHADLFHFLTLTAEKLSTQFSPKTPEKFFDRLFDELPRDAREEFLNDFRAQHARQSTRPDLSDPEIFLIGQIIFGDALILHFSAHTPIARIARGILSHIFPAELDAQLANLRKNPQQRFPLRDQILNFKTFKSHFFDGVRAEIQSAMNQQNPDDPEMNEFLSAIQDDENDPQIPAALQGESKFLEAVMNFYVSLAGNFQIGRADNNRLRLTQRKFLDRAIPELTQLSDAKPALSQRGTLFFLHHKNSLDRAKFTDWIKNGPKKTPKSTSSPQANTQILQQLQESALASFFQEFQHADLKLSLKSATLTDHFKSHFAPKIQKLLKKSKSDFSRELLDPLLRARPAGETLVTQLEFSEQQHHCARENLYSPDLRIFRELVDQLPLDTRHQTHQPGNLTMTLSIFRETLRWFLLLATRRTHDDRHKSDRLRTFFSTEIFLTPDPSETKKILQNLQKKYHDFLIARLALDDNPKFLEIIAQNWKFFARSTPDFDDSLSSDELLRTRDLLKTITRYNKRRLIPH